MQVLVRLFEENQAVHTTPTWNLGSSCRHSGSVTAVGVETIVDGRSAQVRLRAPGWIVTSHAHQATVPWRTQRLLALSRIVVRLCGATTAADLDVTQRQAPRQLAEAAALAIPELLAPEPNDTTTVTDVSRSDPTVAPSPHHGAASLK